MSLIVGHCYQHPDYGPIHIDSGEYLSNGRISNHWGWTVIETGVKGQGYGGPWKDISDQYVTVTIPKAWIEEKHDE